MALGLDEIATAAFRTSAEADTLAQRVKDILGFGAFNVPARLAIARSLAIPDSPPPVSGDVGRSIKGDTLFGTGADLAAWIALLVEHAGKTPETLKELQTQIAAHWARGLRLLDQTINESNNDQVVFWHAVAAAALSMSEDGETPDPDKFEDSAPAGAIGIPIGPVSIDTTNDAVVTWRLSAAGGSPHAGLMGGVGSGKTRTATHMLRAIRSFTPVPLIAFDFKGDMADDQNALHRAFGATVITPPHQPVPLDVLALSDSSPMGITLAAQRLRDSLATLKGTGFGPQQKDALTEAAERAFRARSPCRLTDIRDALRSVYAQRERKEDGAIATLNDLCRLPLFAPDLQPATFFRQSWIIRLTQDLPELVRVSVVTLVTDALDRYLNSLADAPTDADGNRALRVLCVIDEAHRILGNRLPGLSGLIRLSRSKGGAIILISQSPEDFEGEDDEFLSEMGLVAAFGTNASPRAVKRILGAGANLAVLEKGQAWIKLRGEPTARRIVAWR